jgi:signal peptidase I
MTTATATDDAKKPPRDPAREVVETVVFVVVLVLLLKLFVTEAFVIPTGSMAETLYGYQKVIDCPKCAHTFPVNSHDEVEGVADAQGRKVPVALTGYICPNCRHHGEIKDLPLASRKNNSGDRVLVLKPLYHISPLRRRPDTPDGDGSGDVVVFKFPKEPQVQQTAQNYIKRAMGFGGETLGIHRGDLYVTSSLTYPPPMKADPADPSVRVPAPPEEWWQPEHRNRNDPKAVALFAASRDAGFTARVDGGFRMVRKGEGQLLADRRIVWDNDRQPADLSGLVPPRWYAAEGAERWKADDARQPRAFLHTGDALDWLRYRHLAAEWKGSPRGIDDPQAVSAQRPVLIENFLGYNVSRGVGPDEQLWVGDLILECEVQMDAGSEVALELSRGLDRFRATFGGGKVALSRARLQRQPGGKDELSPHAPIAERPCKVTAGTYRLRFANVDARLWVWVDGTRVDFGFDGDYEPSQFTDTDYEPEDTRREGWKRANDMDAPAGIGAKGSVPAVRHVTLHRDIYYTWGRANVPGAVDFTGADLYYVQPGHYFCMGDNSAHSSDSREWGVVPERLMLGRAVFVFFPVSLDWQFGWPPVRPNPGRNRVGFIK